MPVYKKWRCQTCRTWFINSDPFQSLKGCVTYLGKPRNEKEVVYASYIYCEGCAQNKRGLTNV